MGNDLREQLLKAGLATQDQAREAGRKVAAERKQQSKGKKKKKKGQGGGSLADKNSAAYRAAMAQAAKVARDRELNAEREAARRQRSLSAQVLDLLQGNAQEREGGDLAYNFVQDSRIRHIYVNAGQRKALAAGRLAIIGMDNGYYLVEHAVADRALTLEPTLFVHRAEPEPAPEEDDPYADFPVPDDLMW
jgi:uncharacterized protein YaiL (DUF2058 family)